MAVYHLGTNDGTVPFCVAIGGSVVHLIQLSRDGRCFSGPVTLPNRPWPSGRVQGPENRGPILEPDTWCPDCLAIWQDVHSKPYPHATPLKPCVSLKPELQCA